MLQRCADHLRQEVLVPFTNADAVFQEQDGERRKIFGGSCREKGNDLAAKLRADGIETMFVPADIGSVHFVLACTMGNARAILDPTRRFKDPIVLPNDAPVGSSHTVGAFPSNDALGAHATVTLTKTGEKTFQTVGETTMAASLPHVATERFNLDRQSGLMPTDIFDALTMALRRKFDVLIVRGSTGDVFEINAETDSLDSVSIKQLGGKGRIRRQNARAKFDEMLALALEESGRTGQELLDFLADAQARFPGLLEKLLDAETANALHASQSQRQLADYRAEGGDVPQHLVDESHAMFRVMQGMLERP